MTQKPSSGSLIIVGADSAPSCADGVCETPRLIEQIEPIRADL